MRTHMMMTGAMALGAAIGVGSTIVAPALAAPPARDGGALFKQRCQSCHSGTGTIAPNLAGVVGRKAAATGYRYSPALKASGLTWTRPNLDRFLAGPQQVVPGTRMVVRIADPADRAAIVDYLAGTR